MLGIEWLAYAAVVALLIDAPVYIWRKRKQRARV